MSQRNKRKKVNLALTKLTNNEIEKSNDFYHRTYGKSSELDPFMYQSSNDDDDDSNNDEESNEDEYNISNKKRPKISLKRGEFEFEVDELKKRTKNQGIPREDGLPYDPLAEDQGGFFEEEWREEQYAREKILYNDPNYKFIQLVAGYSNANVEVLYEEQDILSIFRRERAITQQQKIAIEEVKKNRINIQNDINRLGNEIRRLVTEITVTKDTLITIDLLENENPESYSDLYDLLIEKNSYVIIEKIYKTYMLLLSSTLSTMLVEGGSDLQLHELTLFLKYYEFILKKFKFKQSKIKETKKETIKKLINELEGNFSKKFENKPQKLILSTDLKLFLRTIASIVYIKFDKITDIPERGLQITYIDKNNSNYLNTINSAIKEKEKEFFKRLLNVIKFIYNRGLLNLTKQDFYVAGSDDLLTPEAFAQKDDGGKILSQYGEYLYINTSEDLKEKQIKINSYYSPAFIFIKSEVDDYTIDKLNKITNDILNLEQRLKKLEKFLPKVLSPIENLKSGKLSKLKAKLIQEKERIINFINLGKKVVDQFTMILIYYKFYLITELDKNIKTQRNYRIYLERSEERLNKLSTGEIQFQDIPQPAYRHRRGWVQSPENSGIVKLKPIVVSSIEQAFVFIKTKINWTSKIELEELQQNDDIRSSFALLVALEMAKIVLRFPKQYLQLKLREFTLKDKIDAVDVLKNHFISFYNQNTNRNEIRFLTNKEKRQSSNNNRDLNFFLRESIGFNY